MKIDRLIGVLSILLQKEMTTAPELADHFEVSRRTDTKFYINFLYLLSKVLNSRDDYKMGYRDVWRLVIIDYSDENADLNQR